VRTFANIVGGLAVISWAYLLFGRGRFWSVRENAVNASVTNDNIDSAQSTDAAQSIQSAEQRSTPPPLRSAAGVIAVVPARDEADVIAQSLSRLLAQPELACVVLVDDNSSDRTAAVARAAAEAIGRAGQLVVITGAALPQGWSGKVWAMRQGVEAALPFQPEFLLLTDADIVHASGSLAALIGLAQTGRHDLVSFMAKLHCDSTVEKLLIPPFVFFFLMLYPPWWIADRGRRVAGAAGGCMLVRREALLRAGGMEAIRHEIIDDCALAAAVKRSGGSVELRLSQMVRSVRPYRARDIARMISRTAFNQLGHSTALLVGSCVGLTVMYLAPPLLLLSGVRSAAVLGGCAGILMAGCYWPMVRFYGLSAAWVLTLPAAAIFYIGATLHSALSYWRGHGGMWKGRVQDPATVE
jgi:hopene-associated glycosyltransferase HpnB